MYRFMVILGSATSAVLCAFAIYFQIMALAKWRADDLFVATRVTDFTTLGTCVEVITADQISAPTAATMTNDPRRNLDFRFMPNLSFEASRCQKAPQ